MKNVRMPLEVAESVARFRKEKMSGMMTITFVDGKPEKVRLLIESDLQKPSMMHYPQERK